MPLIRRLLGEKGELDVLVRGVQRAHAYAQRAKRHARAPVPVQQVHGAVENVIAAIGGPVQRKLAGDGAHGRITQAELHHASGHALLAQPEGHALTQVQQRQARPALIRHIAGGGGGVAHAFDRLVIQEEGCVVRAARKAAEREPCLAQHAAQHLRVRRGQLSYGVDADGVELARRRPPYEQERPDGQRVQHLGSVLLADQADGVRFFQVAAQLGQYTAVAHAYAYRQAGFLPHGMAQMIGDALALLQRHIGRGQIQPGLVDAEGLHPVGVTPKNRAHRLAHAGDLPVIRRDGRQARA